MVSSNQTNSRGEVPKPLDLSYTIGDLMQTETVGNGRIIVRDSYGRLARLPSQELMNLKANPILKPWLDGLRPSSRTQMLIGINQILKDAKMEVKEFVSLEPIEIKQHAKNVMNRYVLEQKNSSARNLMHIINSLCEFFDIELKWKRQEKIREKRKKNEYIPRNAEMHSIADASIAHSKDKSPRNKAIILTAWTTGIRENGLLSMRCGVMKDYSEDDCPIPIKVWNDDFADKLGTEGIFCVDKKLSAYGLSYYYTFVPKEAFIANQEWIAWREARYGKVNAKDLLYINTIGRAIHRNISPTSVNLMFKTASTFVGIDPVRIWFHCCKKAFKKVLVQANIDPEIRIALEAHKVGKSEHNYFDYHDVDFVRKEYKKADWSREGTHKVDQLEKTVTDLLENNKKLEEKVKELSEHKVRDLNKERHVEERLSVIEYVMELQKAAQRSYRKKKGSLTQ